MTWAFAFLSNSLNNNEKQVYKCVKLDGTKFFFVEEMNIVLS